MKEVIIIGAGLAGCECALQLSKHNVQVTLYDMKPSKMSPAHHNSNFCELVCSNTLKSESLEFATGLLKEEMRQLGSEVIACADQCRVPAGDALAVDRIQFASMVTDKIRNNPNIKVIEQEITHIDLSKPTIVASGPLTSDTLAKELMELVGDRLYFYDALAPIVSSDSIDKTQTFVADRWNTGKGDHINCPMNRDEYNTFWEALIKAERVPLKNFEQEKVFEGCLPIEVMAKRDFNALRFGPMKPAGFKQLKEQPFAVLQLRKEDVAGNMYNLVGCQTNLTYAEQKRVFSLVPALKNAEFLRYGAMHRNSFINAPKLLTAKFNLKTHPNIFFAGQLSGVEGYVESIASGLLSAIYMVQYLNNSKQKPLSINTALGALGNYLVSSSENNFQPMHINWGLLAPIYGSQQDKKRQMVDRALNEIKELKDIIWKN